MTMVTVLAVRTFEHAGQVVRAGDTVTMDSAHAAAAGRRGDVSLTRTARPTYQTRDMSAAPLGADMTPEAPERRRRGRPRKRPIDSNTFVDDTADSSDAED